MEKDHIIRPENKYNRSSTTLKALEWIGYDSEGYRYASAMRVLYNVVVIISYSGLLAQVEKRGEARNDARLGNQTVENITRRDHES